ncbi:hypothetical protein FRB90_005193 [Tulasnella sp. 427]|nr:hypothetical protein FRB90_005193 [Tulasnella sp. 427]
MTGLRNTDCIYVPFYTSRMLAYMLSVTFGVITIASVFYAKHEAAVATGDAQAAVSKLTPGVTVTIDTSDVYMAGQIEGIAQLLLAVVSIASAALLYLDTSRRNAVTNAPHVLVSTVFVATTQAKVTSVLPNGTKMPDELVALFAAKMGISPVYKTKSYLLFMAVTPWAGLICSCVATAITFMAWQRRAFELPARSSGSSFVSVEK